MYFRCTDCYAATWVQGLDTSGVAQTLQCRGCGRGFKVRPSTNLTASPREQYETALVLAEGNNVDLPTSYSVLLGIMTLEHAMLLRDRGVPVHDDAPPGELKESPKVRVPAAPEAGERSGSSLPVVEYDPAFADAVARGYLSMQQAIERGSRKGYAQKLTERHGLTPSLALLVADNKISLTAALRKDRQEVAEILRPVKVAVWKKALVAVVCGLILVGIGIYGIHVWSGLAEEQREVEQLAKTATEKAEISREADAEKFEGRRPEEVPKRRVRIRRDPQGRLLEIEGPDPSSVLLAYCANQEPSDRYKPVELTTTVPPLPGTKLGIIRDELDFENRYAIYIRKSLDNRHWIAGDGRQPLVATTAPHIPADAPRSPVLTR